ncbi:hypothetical protein ORI20_04000 [Mycobacterium sp. CVI_P3]|uniref:DUF732 domain-containing protein n=1 Tax=Mycobacterium pinniadriaticum TaxID=2994102 RepID=A0ABT3S8M4_9MYCO|nr:hypothetical protein [Mycobacterium pinniadriaticum]MCX2929422.1 hypothetical protein [Mycobacterium pinniadriaticum]MCX2935846.1 hypothetical protein [Mycobacterium pinniadriaticum]
MTVRRFSAQFVAVSAGVVAATAVWPASAGADPTDPAYSSVLNAVGIGNNGPITQLIEQIGQQICPLIVKPGGNLVSNATTASGHGGLASQVTGFVAEQAIKSQCPAVMTELANGNFAPLVQLLSTANQASGTLNTLSGTAVPSLPSVTLPQTGLLSP